MAATAEVPAKIDHRSAQPAPWGDPILAPGRNCSAVERADRFSLLIDARAYFDALAASFELCETSLLVVGWDIHTKTVLVPDNRGRGRELGAFIESGLRDKPRLEAYLLEWDFSVVYVLERDWAPIFKGLRPFGHPRLHFRLDREQPWSASQHQKLVIIDGALAFVGGIDLTVNRWDTPEHLPHDPRRRLPSGDEYGPFHDVHAALDGPAARVLAGIARERWQRATGDTIALDAGTPPWPADLVPDFEGVNVAIARTLPERPNEPAVREVEQLYLDSIARAERLIYVETQYFTSPVVTAALERRLAEPQGPEIVLILPERCSGWLEQSTMGVLRRAQLRRLVQADRFGRLRAVAPFVGNGNQRVCVAIHAKVMIIDERLLRVGSSNLSSRSMGFDSECDVAIEAERPGDATARSIATLRNRLLAEHLGLEETFVARHLGEGRPASELIDAAGKGNRGVVPIPLEGEDDTLVLDAELVDPEGPEAPGRVAEDFLSEDVARASRHPWIQATLVVALLLALAAAWKWTPLGTWIEPERIASAADSVRTSPLAPLVVVAAYVLGSMLMVPLTALVMATALTFGFWEATLYSLVGATLGGIAGFGSGRWLGRDTVHRLTGSRLRRASELLTRGGLLAVVTVRFVPVAPFTIANLALGAAGVKFHHFALGSALALLPGIIAINLFETNLHEAIANPSSGTVLAVLAIPVVAVLLLAVLRRAVQNAGKNGSRG